jgi:hypothetical protein
MTRDSRRRDGQRLSASREPRRKGPALHGMTGGRIRRMWTGPVSVWSFFVVLWLVVTAVAVGLYLAGASY